MDIDVRQQIKEYLAKENITMKELVDILNKDKSENEQTTPASLSNKLARGTIKYIEILEIFDALGYDVILHKRYNTDAQSSKGETVTSKSFLGALAGFAVGGIGGSIVGGALGATLGKTGATTGSKSNYNKINITSEDAFKIAEAFEEKYEYNPIPTDEELHEMAKMQERLNLELDIEYNIVSILDNIVLNCNPIINKKYKNDIENYMKYAMDEFTLGFKLLPAYRLVYNILTEQSSSDSVEILRFLTKLRNLYAHGGLVDLDNDKLKELYDTTVYYKNLLSNKNID